MLLVDVLFGVSPGRLRQDQPLKRTAMAQRRVEYILATIFVEAHLYSRS